ncbi:hypothetical protein AQUCO_02500036v1 [Aquilegia coerulea]|uniref:Uncharacterized protein n=1 Tax=Aquilegia coerulea TaxID=218851 RepID=A0A2G5D942_AQUCA|nr:hypothetical protein AQUCO_02500036v1 [Aquilegia coerulea]
MLTALVINGAVGLLSGKELVEMTLQVERRFSKPFKVQFTQLLKLYTVRNQMLRSSSLTNSLMPLLCGRASVCRDLLRTCVEQSSVL